MKLKHLLSLVIAATVLLNSCTKPPVEDFNSSADAMFVVNNPTLLSQRTSVKNAGSIAIINKMTSRKLYASTNKSSTEIFVPEIKLDLIKEIFPPTINNVLVRVTHVAIYGNFAYVGYNREGDVRAGAIDILDISNIDDVKLITQIGLPNMDISTVLAEGDQLHFSGAADPQAIAGVSTPAVTGYFATTGAPTLSSLQSLQGTTATDFVFDGEFKYVVSGSQGELVKMKKSDQSIVARVTAPGLLAVRANGSHIVALSAENGLLLYTKDLTPVNNFQTIKNNVEHKRHILVDNDLAFVAEGQSGLGIYDLKSSALKNRITIPTNVNDFEFVGDDEVTTIAMSINADKLFVANGAGGISIYRHENNYATFKYLGSADLNFFQNLDNDDRTEGIVDVNEISSNYILAKDNYVFVAGGRGGLKILKLKDLTTTPNPNPGTGTTACLDCSDATEYVVTKDYQPIELRIDFERKFRGDIVFQNINLNNTLKWCGRLTGNEFNINSGGAFDMGGDLVVNNNLNILTMKLCGTADVKGHVNLNTDGSGLTLLEDAIIVANEFMVGNNIIAHGGSIINSIGKLHIHSNKTIKLALEDSKEPKDFTKVPDAFSHLTRQSLTVGGEFMIDGSLNIGENWKIEAKNKLHTNGNGSIILGSNSTLTVKGSYSQDGKIELETGAQLILHGSTNINASADKIILKPSASIKVYGSAPNVFVNNSSKFAITNGSDDKGAYKLITAK